jgi:eukaryotic-like serine/threonine-protein kinase
MHGGEARIVGGRYQIDQVLGEGGMGVVYRARNVETGHAVAIKAIKVLPYGSPLLEERLVQEARAQAGVRHPNIVAVTDVVRDREGPMIVMELVEGVGLDQLVAQRLSVPELDQLARGLLAGIAAAHRQGWIHRDLKPANVLCERLDGALVPRITDFGLVKAMEASDPSQTRSGAPMGSPLYMSPEQWANAKRVDHRTDLWALGAILYEIAGNQPPFPWDGEDQKELLDRIHAGHYADLRSLRPDLPERMYRAVRSALEPDRERRCADCSHLYELWFDTASPLGRATVIQRTSDRPGPVTATRSEGVPSAVWFGAVAMVAAAATLIIGGLLVAVAFATLAPEPSLSRGDPPPAPEVVVPPVVVPPVVDPGPQTEPEPSPIPAPQPKPAPTPARPEPGTLKVDARPFSEVRLDGRPVGRGLVDLTVAPGSHRIELVVVQGRRAEATHTATVHVRSGQAARYCWDFEQEGVCLDWP